MNFILCDWVGFLKGSRFFKMLGSDEMRAWYGPEHVCLAADRGAVGTLLISDGLFRYESIFSTKVVKIKKFLQCE